MGKLWVVAIASVSFALGYYTALGFYTSADKEKEKEKVTCPAEFSFYRVYGHVEGHTWEKIDFPCDIAEADVFSVYEKKSEFWEVQVPYALPVDWDPKAGSFIYKGIWPVKNWRR